MNYKNIILVSLYFFRNYRSDLKDWEKHGNWFRSIVESPANQLGEFEVKGGIEGNGDRFGIYHNADTTNLIPHLQGKCKHSA